MSDNGFVGQAFPLAIPWIGRRRPCPTTCPMLPALHLRALLVFRLHDERFHFPSIFESVRCLRSGVHVNTKSMHLFDRGSYIFRIQTASEDYRNVGITHDNSPANRPIVCLSGAS